jgi:DNA modification methylase
MIELINSNALRIPLEDESISMCVTSPPYYGLRSYLPDDSPNKKDELGLEYSPSEYIANLVNVFREVKRVLRTDGILWVVVADSYAGGSRDPNTKGKQGTNRGTVSFIPGKFKGFVPNGMKPKDLIGIPWMLAFALREDGWYLRSDVIWNKLNAMCESVKDRPSKSHEYVFLLSKSKHYYYDYEAIKEPLAESTLRDKRNGKGRLTTGDNTKYDLPPASWYRNRKFTDPEKGRNKRTVWNISTGSYHGSHFAVYPPKLIIPCILAGTSEKGCCPECGKPWERVVEKGDSMWEQRKAEGAPMRKGTSVDGIIETHKLSGKRQADWKSEHPDKFIGWQPTCTHNAEPVPCVILDPFVGSGTTLLVARNLGRSAIGLDLSYTYLHDQASKRLELDKLKKWTNA